MRDPQVPEELASRRNWNNRQTMAKLCEQGPRSNMVFDIPPTVSPVGHTPRHRSSAIYPRQTAPRPRTPSLGAKSRRAWSQSEWSHKGQHTRLWPPAKHSSLPPANERPVSNRTELETRQEVDIRAQAMGF